MAEPVDSVISEAFFISVFQSQQTSIGSRVPSTKMRRLLTYQTYCGWLRNPAPVDRWFIHIYPIIGLQRSFWQDMQGTPAEPAATSDGLMGIDTALHRQQVQPWIFGDSDTVGAVHFTRTGVPNAGVFLSAWFLPCANNS